MPSLSSHIVTMFLLIMITSYGAKYDVLYDSVERNMTTFKSAGKITSDFTDKFKPSFDSIDNKIYYLDTVIANTTDELIKKIKSNRIIKLVDMDYTLYETLLIAGVKNLKLAGTGRSKLSLAETNVNVLQLSNTYNVQLDGLIIGNSEQRTVISGQSALSVNHSYNINISNCKLVGVGLVGLFTKDVYNLKFIDSEITECTMLIFELNSSRNVEFKNTIFHDNNLGISVLGGFTNLSREVVFSECDFVDNIPDKPGNPAFNFYQNDSNFEDKILFSKCVFKNNKGFKWYGEKIELDDCDTSLSGIIGMQANK